MESLTVAKSKIDALEAVRCIRLGLSDAELMEKYDLSSKGLQSLFQKLVSAGAISLAELDERMPTFVGSVFISEDSKSTRGRGSRHGGGRNVSAPQAVTDIQAGMGDAELMEKYKVSARGLQDLFNQLVQAGLVERVEIDRRAPSLNTTVDISALRQLLGLDQRRPPQEKANWKCPSCGVSQNKAHTECPACGIVVEKFKSIRQRQDRETP
jgi:uncharacterized protein YidB (DUF937 family)